MDLTHNQLIERYLERNATGPMLWMIPLIRGRHVGFVYESIRHFVDCVADEKPVVPRSTTVCAFRTVILAIMQSASMREPVKVTY